LQILIKHFFHLQGEILRHSIATAHNFNEGKGSKIRSKNRKPVRFEYGAKVLTLFSALLLCHFAVISQPNPPGAPAVVITEIMYNSPESGTDSLEFIELSNPNPDNERSLSGHYFSQGIEFIFPNGYLIGPGAHVVIAKDSVAFENAFNVVAFQWTNSALSNTGEAIVLKNGQDQTIDSVNYGVSFPWPTEANGNGASLVLCNDTLDNDGPDNWVAATTDAGFSVNGIAVFANANADCNGLTGIKTYTKQKLNIYPNPSTGNFLLTVPEGFETGNYAMEILNLNGQILLQKRLNITATKQISIRSNLGTGVYLLLLKGNSTLLHQRLVVQ